MKKPCCVLTLLALFCQTPQAFVPMSCRQPRSRLASAGSHRLSREARASLLSSCNIEGGGGGRTAIQPTRRRKRGRGCTGKSRTATGGVRELRAGFDLPGLGALLEQSTRHHIPSAFTGGTVGVLGTLSAIQLKINEVKELTACPYCRSTGQLPCATCYGVGSITVLDTVASSNEVTTTTLTCPSCRGKGFITCVNCKGDGRGVPLFLNKKVSRDPESEIEDVGYA
ncbi:unnamed protein product [Ectocarpus sp. 12 AP-2014]